MKVYEKIIPYTKSSPIKRVYFLGDIHCGTIAHVEGHLDDAIKTVQNDDDALWIGTGDYGEYITPDDFRWEAGLIPTWVQDDDISHCLEKYIIEKFSKIKDKCIGLHWGNHEYQYTKHKFSNPHRHICEELNVEDLGFSAFVDLIFRRNKSSEAHRIRCCGTHGSSNAITKAGKMNILKRWMDSRRADIYYYAHMHDILHDSRQMLDVSQSGKITNREALGVVTGSFYKTYLDGEYATYGERKTYPPNKLGYPMIEINIHQMTLEFNEKVYLKG